MKIQATVILLAASLGVRLCQAQGTLYFEATLNGQNQVPPNNSPYFASGVFTLRGDSFAYAVWRYGYHYLPPVATINGPAEAGSTAPVLFSLNPYYDVPPDPWLGDPGSIETSGYVTLSGWQKADLLAGLWYVNLASADYPNGEIRGQILLVPEPATWALLGLGAVALLLRCRRGSVAAAWV